MADLDSEQKLLALIDDLDQFSQEKRFSSGLNIFEAAGLYRQEIRHSNFLAFLLRPQESHGLGHAFLQRLIQKSLDRLSTELPIRPLAVELGDFSDALVYREWRKVDLVIESKKNNFLFAIENKVDSSEGEEQLSRYRKIIGDEFPSHRKLFSYLTKDRELASDDFWSSIGYDDVVDALQEAKTHRSSSLTNEATTVIDHYISLIRRNIVPDQELIEQCRMLYARHKDALDLVIRYGNVNAFASAADQFFKKHGDLKPLKVSSGQAVFLPDALYKIVPEIEGTNWWGQSRPIAFWFNLRSDYVLELFIEIGPFSHEKYNREPLVREFLEYFKIKKKPTLTYTRVYREYEKLNEDQAGDLEEILKKMNSLYESATSKHLSSVKDILHRFFK